MKPKNALPSSDMHPVSTISELHRYAWLRIPDENKIVRMNHKSFFGGNHRWALVSTVCSDGVHVPIVVRTTSEGFSQNRKHLKHEHPWPLRVKCDLDKDAYLGDEAFLINFQYLVENAVFACPEIEDDDNVKDYFYGLNVKLAKNPQFKNMKLTDG